MMNTMAKRFWLPDRPIVGVGVALMRLAGIGLVAIGLSGILALAGGRLFGKAFVSGDPPDLTYTADRCADFLEYFPHAATCAAAATAHHFDEVVSYRIAAGLLGMVILGLDRFLVPSSLHERAARVPPEIVETAGATAFGLAAAALLALGLSQLVFSTNGAGAYLSGGLVAAPFAAFYVLRLVKIIGST
jgi:hypothetical protein